MASVTYGKGILASVIMAKVLCQMKLSLYKLIKRIFFLNILFLDLKISINVENFPPVNLTRNKYYE